MMSSLLTNVVRRQALTMVPRRQNSALLLVGPPLTKVTTKDKVIGLALFFVVPMIYPVYIMMNLQKYNGSNRTWTKPKKSGSAKKKSAN